METCPLLEVTGWLRHQCHLKLTTQSVGILHRQEGYRLDVGTSLGGNAVFPFESGGQFLQSTDISGRSCRKGSGGLGVSSRMGEASVEELAPQSAEPGPGSNPGGHSYDHWSPSPRPFLHASPLPWPMSSTATGSTSFLVTAVCLWSSTYPSICIFSSVANWTLDKCYREDGFRDGLWIFSVGFYLPQVEPEMAQ